MSTRKSYFTNFSTNSLFLLMEQNQKELLRLQVKALEYENNHLMIERINQLKLVVEVINDTIIKRYLEEGTSLNSIAKLLENSDGVKQEIYKQLFTTKILQSNEHELISIDLLQQAMNKLDLNQLMEIINAKKETIYEKSAFSSYDNKIFSVDEEVYKELVYKINQDRKEL